MQVGRLLLILSVGALMLAAITVFAWPEHRWTSATEGHSITSPDTEGYVGEFTSLALDASGNPVISYRDWTNDGLRVLHCDDPDCEGDESSNVFSPYTGIVSAQPTSLELDALGSPVVAFTQYYSTYEVGILHCGDAQCSTGNQLSYPGLGNGHTSLALDAAGHPVVGYYTGGGLNVMHCNDPNCQGDNESVTSPDTDGNVGMSTSLALDASGYPVVSYYDYDNGNVKVMHCNDPNCEGADESITSPDWVGDDGTATSLALDASGYPVVAYFDHSNFDLKVMHCNDADCAGGDESIASPDTDGDVGWSASLALDAGGNPVVSYADYTNYDLKVLHCNDANCAGGDESISSPDMAGDVGSYTSLALDASGNPVVSYQDNTNWDLKVLHCKDPNCTVAATSTPTPTEGPTATPTAAGTTTPTPTPTKQPTGDSDGDGCTDQQENGSNPDLGGERDYLNFWDFYDVPTGAGLLRDGDIAAPDIFAVIARFGETGDPGIDPLSTPPPSGYHTAYDRGSVIGPNAWNLGPADGAIAAQDIFSVIAQFGDSCS